MKCARVTVRLEDCKDAPEIAGFGSAERGANLGWMMRVVIDDRHAVTRLDLEPAIDPAKVFKRGGNCGRIDAHITRRGEGGGCI